MVKRIGCLVFEKILSLKVRSVFFYCAYLCMILAYLLSAVAAVEITRSFVIASFSFVVIDVLWRRKMPLVVINSVSLSVVILFASEVILSCFSKYSHFDFVGFREWLYITVLPILTVPHLVVTVRKYNMLKISLFISISIGCLYIVFQAMNGHYRTEYIAGTGYGTISMLIVMILPLMTGDVLRTNTCLCRKLALWVMLLVMLLALVLHGMRGQIIAALFEIVALLIWCHKRKGLYVLGGLLSVLLLVTMVSPEIQSRFGGIVLIPKINHDNYINMVENRKNINGQMATALAAYERLEIGKMSLKVIADHPLAGIGMGNFFEVFNDQYWMNERHFEPVIYHAHNTLLHQTILFGVFGGAIFVAVYINLGIFFYKCSKKGKNTGRIAVVTLAGVFVSGLSDCLIAVNIWYQMFWLVIAVLFAGCNSINEHQTTDCDA